MTTIANVQGPNFVDSYMSGQQYKQNMAAAKHKNALMEREAAEWEAQAPDREKQKKLDDMTQRREFLMAELPLVNDQAGLDAMRQKAVGIWGQEADDNMPEMYDPAQFDTLRKQFGLSSGGNEKFSTSSLVYDESGNAYQVGNLGTVKPVSLGDEGGMVGLPPKDRLDYIQKKKQIEGKASQEAEDRAKMDSISARLPALNEVVGELRELSETATHTLAGKARDWGARELGMGGTEGAVARAKYEAVVSNEVLPLLRETFGAAFTVKEGESLRATLGDPNLSPEEKNAQLDAFIESKLRQAGYLQDRFGGAPGMTDQAPGMGDPLGVSESDPLGLGL